MSPKVTNNPNVINTIAQRVKERRKVTLKEPNCYYPTPSPLKKSRKRKVYPDSKVFDDDSKRGRKYTKLTEQFLRCKKDEEENNPSILIPDVQVEVLVDNSVFKDNSSKKNYLKETKETKKRIPLKDFGSEYDRFFEENSHSLPTSKNILPDSNMLNVSQYTDIINKIPLKHEDEINLLSEQYKEKFIYWSSDLKNGFNLCFYGFGSKMEIIDEFAKYLNEQIVLRIEGFDPNFNFQTTLELLNDVNEIVKPNSIRNIENQITHIQKYFSNENREHECLFIIIHNLDGPTFRDTQNLNYLAKLVNISNVRLIATVDNINFPMLLDHDRRNKFNFLWHEITTFRSYDKEITHENLCTIKKRKNNLTTNLVKGVLSVWNENRRLMFKILATYQINQYNSTTITTTQVIDGKNIITGMERNSLYKKCYEEFIVNGESNFNTFLNDFHYHNVIKSRMSEHGKEIYYIPLEAERLKEILESKDLFKE
ncbi:1640_t:CDS:1 [Diversispora eburnea]|uniref:Origin recognition complex subunit 2 n=1 Tax=Diversispora eburnea TaxID=1213867 RepID=A0A9N8VK83_9GLOM|nr:1640_t:CDS:1 [Diversispora eburnea]